MKISVIDKIKAKKNEIYNLCVVFFICAFECTHIYIDDENIPQVADFLQTFAHGPIQSYEHSCFLRNFKKISTAFIQMVALMLTLTGSSLLTAKISPSPMIKIPEETKMDICVGNFTNFANFNERFKSNFGCLNNACWRSCYSDKETNFWCYTSPTINDRKYKECTHHSDCTPYWECLHPCQTGK